MIQFPDEFLLSKIEKRNLYCDRQSLEKFTGIKKDKYKLAGTKDIIDEQLHIYRFFVTTSKKESCEMNLTLIVEPSNWTDIDPRYKSIGTKNSYIDIKRIEVMDKDGILSKIKDPHNGFSLVAKLSDEKFLDLVNLQLKILRSHKPITPTKQEHIIKALMDPGEEAEKVLKQLGLIK